MLTINEIFHSIQGESTHSGRPCVFVRLAACDLRCSWCDTPYAFFEGTKRSVDDVVDEVERFLRSQAVAPDPGETPDVALRDPQDLKVPAAALAGRVDVFVTGDREILGAAREIPIRVVNPRGLWELLRQRRRGVPPHRD